MVGHHPTKIKSTRRHEFPRSTLLPPSTASAQRFAQSNASPSKTEAIVSSTRLYLGNLPRNTTQKDIEDQFTTHGSGSVKEIKLMDGFGFIEFENAMDTRDVVPAFHGSDFMGERITVQFARGPRRYHSDEYSPPRPQRSMYRLDFSVLALDATWQDLKRLLRETAQLDIVYAETEAATSLSRSIQGFVEVETSTDLERAMRKLRDVKLRGRRFPVAKHIFKRDELARLLSSRRPSEHDQIRPNVQFGSLPENIRS